VAILVPAAVVAALVLSVVGGGSDVGSLGEVLRGPAVPPAEAAEHAPQPRAPAQRHGAPPVPARAAATVAPRQRPRTRPTPRRPSSHPPVRTLPVKRPAARRPAPHPTAPSPAPSAPPPSQPSRPHPIHDVGTQVAETVRPLPLAGPAAADAVEAVVNLVDPA
jgi:hypothetical protein